jgi:predicted small secreted protein
MIMRRILTAAAIAGAILLGGCNTVRGVGRDVKSLGEVVPSGHHAQAATAQLAPASEPTATP